MTPRAIAGRLHELLHPHSLRSVIRRHLRTLGLDEPIGMRIQASCVDVPGECRYQYTGPQWQDEAMGIAHPALLMRMEMATRDLMLHRARVRMLRANGPLGTGRTSWTYLVHPMALRMALMAQPDRTRMANDDWPMMFDRVVDAQIIALSNGRLDVRRFTVRRSTEHWMSFLCIDGLDESRRPELLVEGLVIPMTVATALTGRRLVDVIDLPPSGNADVDEAVQAIGISHATSNDKGTVLTLAPTTLIPYGMPPAGRTGWHADAGMRI